VQTQVSNVWVWARQTLFTAQFAKIVDVLRVRRWRQAMASACPIRTFRLWVFTVCKYRKM